MNHEKNIIDQIQQLQGGKPNTKRNKNATKIHKIAKGRDIAIAIIPKKTIETKKIENQRKNLKVEEKSKSTPVQMPVTMKSMDVIRTFINRGKYFKLRSIALTHTPTQNTTLVPTTHAYANNTVTKTDFTDF